MYKNIKNTISIKIIFKNTKSQLKNRILVIFTLFFLIFVYNNKNIY